MRQQDRRHCDACCLWTPLLVILLTQLSLVVLTRAEPFLNSITTGNKFPATVDEGDAILLLDVDNTLYAESDLPSPGLENQIVKNIHSFCRLQCNLTVEQSDELHCNYGSTVQGLLETTWKHLSPEQRAKELRNFYRSVYRDVDVSTLLQAYFQDDDSDTIQSTGYSQEAKEKQRRMAQQRRLLKKSPFALHLASNSPANYISKVVQALGLARVPWKGVWTPDWQGSQPRGNDYPTKQKPTVFFKSLINQIKKANTRKDKKTPTKLVLVDDSSTILAACARIMDGCWQVSPVNHLIAVLAHVFGWIRDDNNSERIKIKNEKYNYTFSAVEYLRAKNIVDREAINIETWELLAQKLAQLLLTGSSSSSRTADPSVKLRSNNIAPSNRELCIVDVGSGILSMLQLFLHGSSSGQRGQKLPSLIHLLQQGHQGKAPSSCRLSTVNYYAYEPNRELEAACVKNLQELNFTLQETIHWETRKSTISSSNESSPVTNDNLKNSLDLHSVKEMVWIKPPDPTRNLPRITVYFRAWDYKDHAERFQPKPHLIVGCCFADLMEPYTLSSTLMRRFLSFPNTAADQEVGNNNTDNYGDFDETLVYFPITFRGITQFVPSLPQQDKAVGGCKSIPSDTSVFRMYAKALQDLYGHNLNPDLLVDAMMDFGATCLAGGGSSSRSDWVIDASQHEYLWKTMLYFFGSGVAPHLQVLDLDANGWLHRARARRPTIQVSNTDLLFRWPHLGKWCLSSVSTEGSNERSHSLSPTFQEIQFTAPKVVNIINKDVTVLGPSQVRIQSQFSLISSGTELKIFKGQFDDAPLDVNIKGMEEERMSYPLAYGYSLVGRVVECGDEVEDRDSLLGATVFAFSPHATQAVVERSAIQLIPNGMDARDAIFMPSVETALALVHDAHARLGERVAVFGQGLIGLFVTALVRKHFGMVTAFDTLPDRLAMSTLMGASQALFPSEAARAGPFDISIEVSGNGRALQSAIDTTCHGGRIIIGSWYGSSHPVSLDLGSLDFHRSHKTLKASQVSEIPADMGATWTKQRRFSLAWELVRQLKPSRLITRFVTLSEAQRAYEALDKGDEIAVVFKY